MVEVLRNVKMLEEYLEENDLLENVATEHQYLALTEGN